MSDQPYDHQGYPGHHNHQGSEGHQGHDVQQDREGHQGHQGQADHDPYAQHPHQAQQQAWPGQQQRYDDPQAHLQYTQQWQGQTWETSVQPPVTAADPAETAYLPPQTGGSPAYGNPQAAYGDPAAAAAPLPPEHRTPADGRHAAARPASHASHAAYASHASHARAAVPASAAAVSQSAGGSGSGYGPATVAGNARVTDAQRARLEGRSPIIEPGMQPAALTALLGLLLSGTAAIGSYALLVPLVVLQAVTAAGWFRLNGMWPARQGIALAFLGALVADAVLLAAGREHAPAAILGTLGVWVLLCLILQLRSHADPDERMYGLMATVTASALAVLAAGHLGADPEAVSVGAAAVAVAVLARALPLPTPASVVVALLAGAGAGIAVGGMTGLGAKGALLGAGAAVCALIGHRVASYDYPSRFVHFTAGVALPLAAAAPAVYVLGRALA
ncbi:hypothetical protein C6376_11195 [Streptomyces sp. P3]|uniref:hypothetical protein n=1 Tax=Streptomyces sp. P3 TaxID=2135430 RepID=UPI000D1AD577|nr:hypothetical protein [Streptomyces sp. P3]AVV47407.1 hypothetical protein C6376_11195 [Streptomyces sp. P3]